MAECGVIFDLDGVLIDSEGLYYRAYSTVLEPYGVTVTPREYEEYWIARGIGPEYVVEKHKLPVEPDELRRRRSPVLLDLLKTDSQLMPHVEPCLDRLANGFPLSVATNSFREHLDFLLDRFGIGRFFTHTVAREDYARSKPAPDAFLAAAEKLGFPPNHCVAVEDTFRGVTAATRAGIACLAVPNDYTRHNDFSQAARVLSSLADLTPELIHEIVTAGE